MPFECYPVVVLKCHAAYMHFQFTKLIASLKPVKTERSLRLVYVWHIQCIYLVYVMYIPGISIWSFEGELCVLNLSCFNIRLSSMYCISLQHSITHNCMKKKIQYPWYKPGIYQVYTTSRNIHGIYMVYTDYIPRRGSRCSKSLSKMWR